MKRTKTVETVGDLFSAAAGAEGDLSFQDIEIGLAEEGDVL